MTLAPPPLALDPHQKKDLLRALEAFRQVIEQLDSRKSCLSCKHMQSGVCGYWKSTPPPEWIKTGCDQWVFDESSPPF